MSNELLLIIVSIAVLPFIWEIFAIAINYTWYWRDYRCRLEPWTREWCRYVAKWWWVVLTKMGFYAGYFLWLLLFPLSNASTGVKIAILVAGILVVVFYAWLLLHLGGFALRLIRKIRQALL